MPDAPAPSAPPPPAITLAQQIEEVEGEIRQRGRLYPDWVAKGRYKPETAERKLATMRAVQSTLTWLEQNEHWIRPAYIARREATRRAAEDEALRAELMKNPAVRAVVDAFPDAEVHLPRPPAPEPEPYHYEDPPFDPEATEEAA
jgi:hypothetical protein